VQLFNIPIQNRVREHFWRQILFCRQQLLFTSPVFHAAKKYQNQTNF